MMAVRNRREHELRGIPLVTLGHFRHIIGSRYAIQSRSAIAEERALEALFVGPAICEIHYLAL